jgi:hypothetical protein
MILVTAAEQAAARQWLAKRGQPVERPAPLVTALIATRQSLRGGAFRRYLGYAVAGVVVAVLYSLSFGSGATGSGPIYFVYFAMALSMRDAIRLRERSLREDVPSPHPPDSWWRVLGGWYLASLVLAFAGGVALAVAMYFATPARTYAVSWLGLLALSALCTGWVLAGVLRSPLLAEDAETLAIARAVRAEKIYAGTPVLAAFPLVLDLLDHVQPPAFTPWLIGYVAAVVVLQVVAFALHGRRYRTLPPGHYGTPVPDQGSPVGWSPRTER